MDGNIVLIVLIIVVGVVVIAWLLRKQLTAIVARGSVATGEVEVRAEAKPDATGAPNASVNITRTKSFGTTNIDIERDGVNVDDNLFTGKTDVQVKDSQKKPRQ